MLRRVALVRTDVSEERCASIIRVTKIGELGTLVVTSNRRTLGRNTRATRCNIPENGIPHSHRRDNLNLTHAEEAQKHKPDAFKCPSIEQ
jgi:hypothetical protein